MKWSIQTLPLLASPVVRQLTYCQLGLWFALSVRISHEPDLTWTADDLAKDFRVYRSRSVRFNKDLQAIIDAGMVTRDRDGFLEIAEEWL